MVKYPYQYLKRLFNMLPVFSILLPWMKQGKNFLFAQNFSKHKSLKLDSSNLHVKRVTVVLNLMPTVQPFKSPFYLTLACLVGTFIRRRKTKKLFLVHHLSIKMNFNANYPCKLHFISH